MTDLLDGQDFFELMQAYRWSELPINQSVTPGFACVAFEDVKNYIRIHCVVPEEKDEGVPWD